uniref:ADP-ribosylation factor-related protein 1-like isoform X1 n=1 Tax=Rhizophora mucronata TaxID=61149 RepID=A0A2P2L2C1_RHIMU
MKDTNITSWNFDCRMGIKESVEWLVEVMERSKRTELLRVRAGATGLGA